jgi:hypothetical protein
LWGKETESCRAQKPRISPVSRYFFELPHLLASAAAMGDRDWFTGRDTCFVNIVRGE